MPKSKEFVSTSESDSDSGDEPKQKKKKVESKPKKEKKEDKEKEDKADKAAGGDKKKDKKYTTNKSGDKMFQISRMRYVTISEFRGKKMVGIREYYEADGELRPGKKGISLTMEQWNSLKDQLDDIEDAIKEF